MEFLENSGIIAFAENRTEILLSLAFQCGGQEKISADEPGQKYSSQKKGDSPACRYLDLCGEKAFGKISRSIPRPFDQSMKKNEHLSFGLFLSAMPFLSLI